MRARKHQPVIVTAGVILAIALSAGAPPLPAQAGESSSAAIDAGIWSVISTTVAEHDIAGMGRTYHPDAVVVTPRGTMPISRALAGWGEGMEKIRREKGHASVAFRFSRRQDGAETAYESGMFNYAVTDSTGTTTRYIIPFEALLVKKDGRWLVTMERQLDASDEATWNAMPE